MGSVWVKPSIMGLQKLLGLLSLRIGVVRDYRPGWWWDQVAQVTPDGERDCRVTHTPFPISLLAL